jgi:transcriptional accessory protein Tex/SPT6
MPKKSKFDYSTTTNISRNGKELTKFTIRIYKTKINKLSTITNYTTIQEFIDNPKDVINAINAIIPIQDTEDDKILNELRNDRRSYLNALMWIFKDIPYENRIDYYEYYLTQKHIWPSA